MLSMIRAFDGFLGRWNLSRDVEVIIKVKSLRDKAVMEYCIKQDFAHSTFMFKNDIPVKTLEILGIPIRIESP